MPFKSEKQRRYLWANEPEIAREWTDRYGASQGGITRLPFQDGTILPQPRPSEEDLATFALTGADLTGNTYFDPVISDDYMKAFKVAQAYSKQKPPNWTNREWNEMNMMVPRKGIQLDLGDTLGGGIHRIPVDTGQGYSSNIRHGTASSLVRDDVAKWWDPSSVTMTPWGEEKYLKEPNLWAKTMGHLVSQLGGAAEEGIIGNFFSNPKQTLEDYLSNFAGTSQTDYYTTPEQKAAQLAKYYSGEGFIPNTLASLASENFKSLDRDELAKNIIQPDGSLMTMGPNFNYGKTQAEPSDINAPFMNYPVSDDLEMYANTGEFEEEEVDENGNPIWEGIKTVGRYFNPFKKTFNPLGFLPRNLPNRTQVTPRDRAINRAYMQQYGVGTDDTGRMTGGLFAGKNAPGTSAFGSANIYDMANKWHKKYGGMNYKTKKQQEKQKKIANIVKSQQTGGNNGGNNNSGGGWRGGAPTHSTRDDLM